MSIVVKLKLKLYNTEDIHIKYNCITLSVLKFHMVYKDIPFFLL